MRFLFGILTIVWLLFGWVCYSALQPEPPAPAPWHAAEQLQRTDLERINHEILQSIFFLSSEKATANLRINAHYRMARAYWLKAYFQISRVQQIACLELSLGECFAALKLSPDNPDLHYSIADLYHQLKRYDEAEQYYLKALKLASDVPLFRRRYYEMLEESGKRKPKTPSKSEDNRN